MSKCCADCRYGKLEEQDFRGKHLRYIRCRNEAADRRCGWIVQMGMQSGAFSDCEPPRWCPGFEEKGVATDGNIR